MPPIEDNNSGPIVEEGQRSVIGIIYPPPEVRNIVDKTASFVARNGPEFETRIRQNELNNPKFNFLNPADPYHAYYQHKVKEFKEGKAQEPAAPKTSLGIQRLQPEPAKTQEPIIPKEPPPEFEFIADPPSISAFDLDVVKLTAQFVARNGRQFLTNLINREKNYQFDFLRPQHSLFTYFTKLVEQYTKVLIPPKDLLPKMRKESQLNKEVLDQVKYRVEWAKFQEREKRKEEEALERERVAYAQIDWHDFVVVETVDFQPGEVGNFPPPTTPDEVGARLLASERYDSTAVEDQTMEMDVDSDEEGERTDNNQVQDMDEGSDDEMEDARPRPPTPPPPPPSEMPMAPPLPPQPDQVIIRKDYNPKAMKVVAAAPAPDQFLISPITGEKIPADKIEEHMRIGLLDPKWVEEQSKTMVVAPGMEEVYAPGSSIGSSLKQLAERRTDIFGSGAEEAQIGKKIGEEDKRTKEKVIWDGHTASMERVTQKARENISIEEQIAVIHKNKGLVHDEEKEKIGPAMPSHSAPGTSAPMISAPLPPPPKTITVTQVAPMQAPPSMPRPPTQVVTMQPQRVMMMAPRPPPMQIRPPVVGIPGPPMPPMPPMQMQRPGGYMQQMPPRPPPQKPVPEPPGGGDEPPSKKAKTEESLMPEGEFLKRNKGPVTFKVVVPNLPDKADWKLSGQTITYSLPLTDTVAVLKAKLHEDLSMPAGKQKLQYEGLFVKDSNSLAYYNFAKNGIVHLQLKERGGRKK